MGLAANNVKTIGYFTEMTHGKLFDYTNADQMILSPLAHGGRNVVFPHMIFVGFNGETRYAYVKGSVAHVIVDETENGWTIEKWNITKHHKFAD
jgi:hypothetical protein